MEKPIQVTRSAMPDFDEYVEEIRGLWDSRWLTNMGAKHNKLESMLCDYLRTPNVALFANGHLALESAIDALGCNGEVITTPFTFVSTTHAIVRRGLKPVFCDVNKDDYTIDVGSIEELITERTSAIMAVHVFGNVCDVYKIESLAEKYNLKVIYDAAHAFGVSLNGRSIATFGDISMFSFHATKVFHTIEGGALAYAGQNLKAKMKGLRDFGIAGSGSVIMTSGNAKMNEFQAAMGLCNLRHIEDEIEKRRIVVERYRKHLGDIKGIRMNPIQENVKSNYAYFPVVFDGYRMSRDEVFEVLRAESIFPRKYFYPLTSDLECYRDEFDSHATPVAKELSGKVLTLPLYGELELRDVDVICDIILNGGGR